MDSSQERTPGSVRNLFTDRRYSTKKRFVGRAIIFSVENFDEPGKNHVTTSFSVCYKRNYAIIVCKDIVQRLREKYHTLRCIVENIALVLRTNYRAI